MKKDWGLLLLAAVAVFFIIATVLVVGQVEATRVSGVVTLNAPTTATADQSSSAATALVKKPVSVTPPKPLVLPKVFVPILMYHYIRDYSNPNDPVGNDLSVSPAVFRSQVLAMQQAGYHAITLSDYAAKNYADKSFIVTFDDGYEDAFTNAFPVLQELGMKGTFFIITDFVNRDGYMTRDQINQMAAAGMEMGAHTLDHKDLAVLSNAEANRQIVGSLFGVTPVFAYPSGEYSSVTVQLVKNAGIKAAVTTRENVATDLDSLYMLPRVRVKQHTQLLSVINGLIYQLKHPAVTN